MPRRVDAREHLLEEIRRRVPLQFKLVTANDVPPTGDQEVVFWKDTSNAGSPVGKIVLRIGHERFIFSSAKESVSAGTGEVFVNDDDCHAARLDTKLQVTDPLTKSIIDEPGSYFPPCRKALQLGLDPSKIDHGTLGGLDDDDHAQYLLLAGRAGGQEAWGGTGDSDSLILHSTSAATPGHVWIAPATDERVAFGQHEYTPLSWSDRKYDGKFFFYGIAGEGPYNSPLMVRAYQEVNSASSEAIALSALQAIKADTSANVAAIWAHAQFNASTHATVARALMAYTSTAYTFDPTCDLAIGATAYVESSNNGHYTDGRGFHAQVHVYGSSQIDTWAGFYVESPDLHSGCVLGTARGLHVEDIVGGSSTAADAILVEAQSTSFDALSGNLRFAGGDWNTGHVQLGTAHLWASSGDLHFHRSAPAADTDASFSILADTVDFHSRRGVNLVDPAGPQDAATKAYVDSVVITDHGQLSGLGDDDHPQYALLAGRAGGQVLHGGTADSEDLVLRSTAGTTLGHVHVADRGAETCTVGWKDTESVPGKLFVGLNQADGWRYGVKVQFTGDAGTATWPDALKAECTLAGSAAQDGRGHTGVAGFCQLDNDFSEPNSEGRGGVFAFICGSATSATLGLAVGARCGIDVDEGNTVNVANTVEAKLQVWDTATVGEAVLLRAFTPVFDPGTTCNSLTGLLVEDLGAHPAAVHAIQVASQTGAAAAKGNVYLAGGGWNTGHLRLGDGHLWTSGGSWRFATAEPTSDTDYAFAVGTTIDVANRRIENVTDPVNAQDAATKAYVDSVAGSGGLSDAYASITDGTTTASASGSDTFKLRSANDRLSIAVTNDDATHGDNALFTLNEGNIVHQNLSGAGTHDHSELDSHVDASSGVHGVTGDVVGTTDTQTLTNKTLTSPSISDASLSGTSTLASAATLDGSASDAVVKIPDISSSSEYNNGGTSSIACRIGQANTRGWTNGRVIDMGQVAYVAYRQLTVSVLDPQAGDSITLLETHDRIYVREVVTCVRGSSSPSVNFNLKWSTDRADASPNSLWSSDQTANQSTAQSHWGLVNRSLSRKAFLWLDISNIGGTVDEFSITVYYTIKIAQDTEGD